MHKKRQKATDELLSKQTLRAYVMNTCKNEKGKNTSFFHCLLNKASLSQGRKKGMQVHNASGSKNTIG